MTPQRFTFDDLGGGLNEGESPHQIADNQFVLLENFTPIAKRIIRRNGTYKKSLAAFSSVLTGLFIHRHLNGTPTPIFGTPTGFAKFTGDGTGTTTGSRTGTISSIPFARVSVATEDAIVIPYSLKPWVFAQLQGVAYAMREESPFLLRVTPASYGEAGIAAPTAAPTIAVNAAGNMTAGARTVRVTFRNSITGVESDLSPESNSITLGADDSIDVTVIPISSNPQVNERRLWVNAPGTTGVWLLGGSIANNSTTTANINKRVSELGAAASTRNGLPPPNIRVGDVFLDSYLVISDGQDVFISEPFRQESFSPFSVFNVFRGDGHAVTVIKAFKRQLIIGKTNKVHVFTKNGAVWSRDTLSEKHGFYSQHSVQATGDFLIGYGGDDFYMTDGNTMTGIGSIRVKKLLARIPTIRKEFVSAVVYPKLSLYIAFVHVDPAYLASPTTYIDEGDPPAEGTSTRGTNNVAIVYNYKTNAWSTWTWGASIGAPLVAVFDHDTDFDQALFSIHYDSHYYQMDRGRRDGSTLIRARARSKAFRFSPGHGLLSSIRRLFLNITTAAATITLRLYKDRETVAAKERAGLTLYDADFPFPRDDKGFNMRTSQKGALWQYEIDYEAEAPVEVSGVSVEAIPIAQRVRMR